VDRPDLDESEPHNDINDCSHHTYRMMRDDAPLWFDLDLGDAHKHPAFGFGAA
jgi:hypothetical protein